ncbi:hypothetical protein P171DRAFT_439990 [Karstenula rhodostoma CBS 690.94]|uniref:Uncharacterized protein n=1 Tax=Karstenula rhodostoma CBS 690.94 TaxID=1392251 RepID=A0A9P4PSN2_9PLEO|nr:hypothetical protein P171DRAFT_439990 [Karstenula rhodostoma CBS 690.94]
MPPVKYTDLIIRSLPLLLRDRDDAYKTSNTATPSERARAGFVGMTHIVGVDSPQAFDVPTTSVISVYDARSDTWIQPVFPPTSATLMIYVLRSAHVGDLAQGLVQAKRKSRITMQDATLEKLSRIDMGVYILSQCWALYTIIKETDERNIVCSTQTQHGPTSFQVSQVSPIGREICFECSVPVLICLRATERRERMTKSRNSSWLDGFAIRRFSRRIEATFHPKIVLTLSITHLSACGSQLNDGNIWMDFKSRLAHKPITDQVESRTSQWKSSSIRGSPRASHTPCGHAWNLGRKLSRDNHRDRKHT